jgi:hypothetical protein
VRNEKPEEEFWDLRMAKDKIEAKGLTMRDMLDVPRNQRGHIDKTRTDAWCARLLATNWISLLMTFNTLKAVGIKQLGPLSLQAIVVRELRASKIASRIAQLEHRGIHFDNSVYCRALTTFAKDGSDDLIQAMLENDLHPETYSDSAILQELLDAFESSKNWKQHRLLLAVQVASGYHSKEHKYNFATQQLARAGDHLPMLNYLEVMRMERIPVALSTIHYILTSLLQRRQKGFRPQRNLNRIWVVEALLKRLAESQNYVPPGAWIEIIRRQGMLGRIEQTHELCRWLLDWYTPRKIPSTPLLTPPMDALHVPGAPNPTAVDPLRQLFTPLRIQALVEWSWIRGFVGYAYSMERKHGSRHFPPTPAEKAKWLRSIVGGVRFVRELRERGVYVRSATVAQAVKNRLIILYGPWQGMSSRGWNRNLANPWTLDELLAITERAWGRRLWDDVQEVKASITHRGRALPKPSWQPQAPGNWEGGHRYRNVTHEDMERITEPDKYEEERQLEAHLATMEERMGWGEEDMYDHTEPSRCQG